MNRHGRRQMKILVKEDHKRHVAGLEPKMVKEINRIGDALNDAIQKSVDKWGGNSTTKCAHWVDLHI